MQSQDRATHTRCSAILQHYIVLGELLRLEKLFVLWWYLSFSQLCGSNRPKSAVICDVLVTIAAEKKKTRRKRSNSCYIHAFAPEFSVMSLQDLSFCTEKRILIFRHDQITFQFILLLDYTLGLYLSCGFDHKKCVSGTVSFCACIARQTAEPGSVIQFQYNNGMQ